MLWVAASRLAAGRSGCARPPPRGHRFHVLLQLVPDFEERVKNIAELRKKADDSRKERQGVGKQDVQLVEAMVAYSNELSASLCDRARKGHSDREEKEFKSVGVA
tara:strand:+ start:208 stop:522 length:315 start_codon:yes stop_codon:yes gene_type:complete